MFKPFFISPPRTRSSVLFETLIPYVADNTELLPVVGHSEPFLHTVQNKTIIDGNTGTHHLAEMYPIMTDKSIDIHYIYPWVYNTNRNSIIEKLKLLHTAREQGHEYYIKATYNIAEALDEVLDFFDDYDIILTLRKDVSQMVISMLFAVHSKMFHVRESNWERYQEKLTHGVTVNQKAMAQLEPFLDKIATIYKLAHTLNNATVLYYENLETPKQIEQCLTTITKSTQWKNYNPGKLPIKVDKDYSKLIHNYDEVMSTVEPLVKKYSVFG